MELIDTPNPNAKKIMTDLAESILLNDLNNIDGVSSVFFGPGFITISKLEDKEWETITQEINNCLLYTSPSPRDRNVSRMPSSA